jgi:16S rRNA (cytosine967-C5)-methyltransferase
VSRPARRTTARSAALEVIRRVVEGGAYSNRVVPAVLERSALSARDRALAAELAYGTIRRLIPIDHRIGALVDRPLASTRPGALALLRLGAYQLGWTRIPDHAAVAETVALGHPRERGFLNAVLRRLARDPPTAVNGEDDDAISIRTGLSPWAVRELRRYGDDDVEAAASALAEAAPMTLRPNTCRIGVEELEAALAGSGIGCTRGELHAESLLIDGPRRPASALPGHADGWFAVQDQASSFVVRALAPSAGDVVLDVCAGPGGKTGHLACLVGERGRVVAGDASPARLALVRRTLDRLGLEATLLVQDGRRPAVREGFDAVLVDAPCSGIGAARRRPELLWRPARTELSGLARLQVGIATAAAGLLRPGGRLVYSVCTFPRAETDAACDAILRRAPFLRPLPIPGPDGPAERVRLWPHVHGTDAMFVAAFTRSASDLAYDAAMDPGSSSAGPMPRSSV